MTALLRTPARTVTAVCGTALLVLLGPAAVPAQSSQPVQPPATCESERRILAGVHSDVVAPFVDTVDGRPTLSLGTKADVDGESGKRLDPNTLLFHVEDDVMRTAPGPGPYGFLGPAGSALWVAPEVRTSFPTALWPGFSTESIPAGVVEGDTVALELTSVSGPGAFHLYSVDTESQPQFLLTVGGPAWQLPINRHVHANWAFSRPGRYDLTFRASARIGGRSYTDTTTYRFQVSDLENPFTGSMVPTLTGTAQVGRTLTVRPGSWQPQPTLSYRWLRDGVAIPGQTRGSYLVGSADLGRRIGVEVTGSKAGFATRACRSATTTAVRAGVLARTPRPKIRGKAKVGRLLRVATGARETGTALRYQWLRGGKAIRKATEARYRPVRKDRGKRLSVRVTTTKKGYLTVTKTSKRTARIRR